MLLELAPHPPVECAHENLRACFVYPIFKIADSAHTGIVESLTMLFSSFKEDLGMRLPYHPPGSASALKKINDTEY